MSRPWLRVSSCGWIALSLMLLGADWSRFRGPGGLGESTDKNLPATWTDEQNVVWKTALPGPGSSSPITVGNHVYLTCYSGYALSTEEPGEIDKLKRHVVCLDRTSGKLVWQKEFQPQLPESEYSGGNNTWHGYSTSTPISDGQSLYVFFGRSGVYALDLTTGETKWHADVGSRTTGWGSGTSLVLYSNLLIVNASVEGGNIVALNKQDGKSVWQIGSIRGAWNTPCLVELPGGKAELVLSLPGQPEGKIVGYDPNTGEQLWSCKGIPDGGYVCPSVIAHEGIVYSIGGRKNTAIAVRCGGRGDVSESHLLWTTAKGSNVASPVYHNGYIYWVHERQGTAHCLNAKTGESVYQERLEPRPGVVYSSLTVADGKLYAVSQFEGTFVLAAQPEFKLLAHNTFANDKSRSNACLAVSNGQLLLRNDSHIYCLGAK